MGKSGDTFLSEEPGQVNETFSSPPGETVRTFGYNGTQIRCITA